MPKRAKSREAVELRRIKKPGFHAVGEVAGLLLKVTPSGSRSWVLRATVGARRRDIGLGGFPDVTLAGARDAARSMREAIRKGLDPVDERRRRRDEVKREQETRLTFREAWSDYWKDRAAGFSKKTADHWRNSVESYALPVIGSVMVPDLETRHIEKALRPIWQTKPPTAKKLRGRLEAILSWATVKGLRHGDNPARWRDNLKELLPRPSRIHKTTHFRAVPVSQTPAFMADLRTRQGNAARALEFLVLTAVRSGEVRGARWQEIDLQKQLWTIPAERMKMDESHTVPLPAAAIAILRNMPENGELIFPAPRGGELSDMSLLAVLKRMGWHEKTTVHGFRSAFKDWATESTDFPDFVSEMALAHSVGDDVQKAYRRSDLVAKRLNLMRQWAAFLGYGDETDNVVPIAAVA